MSELRLPCHTSPTLKRYFSKSFQITSKFILGERQQQNSFEEKQKHCFSLFYLKAVKVVFRQRCSRLKNWNLKVFLSLSWCLFSRRFMLSSYQCYLRVNMPCCDYSRSKKKPNRLNCTIWQKEVWIYLFQMCPG